MRLPHIVNVIRAKIHEAGKARSPEWPKVEKEHLTLNPTCASCGSMSHLQVHHEKPFHADPALELDPTNLITLCMDAAECHIRIGHGGSFKAYNPQVALMSALVLANPTQRDAIEMKSKALRLPNEPESK